MTAPADSEHITSAVELLDDILRRMAGHQDKKRSLLRRLRTWDDAFAPLPDGLAPDPPTPVH